MYNYTMSIKEVYPGLKEYQLFIQLPENSVVHKIDQKIIE